MDLPNLPVETWHKILGEAISMPTFLDANCLSEVTNPLHLAPDDYDLIYWRMEKQRQCLRLVCKSWGIYLGELAHRYVRMADVLHGHVQEVALHQAIRIRYGPCGEQQCQYCFKSNEKLRDLPDLLKRSTIEVDSSPREMKVEIIDVSSSGAKLLLPMIVNGKGYKAMSRLKVIIGMWVGWTFKSRDNSGWTRIMTLLPALQFIEVINPAGKWDKFCANNVTTLSYNLSMTMAQDFKGWPPLDEYPDCLPSLRHLRIGDVSRAVSGYDESMVEKLIRLLTAIGANLLSLRIGNRCMHHMIVPDQIWDLCPRLERFDSGFRFISPPPPSHPVNTISTLLSRWGDNIFLVYTYLPNPDPTPFPSSLIKNWPSLKRLILRGNTKWNEIPMHTNPFCGWLGDLLKECAEHKVILEDNDGVLFGTTGLDGPSESHND